MGKDPDQIERQIREHRDRIGQRIDGLQQRVREDVETARSEAKDRVNGAMDDTKRTLKPDTLMQEHPMSSVAGAMGVGVLLGVASHGFSSGNGHAERYFSDGKRSSSGGGDSTIGAILGTIVGPAARTAQDELQQLVKEGFSAFKDQANQVAEGVDRSNDTLRKNRDVGVE